MFIRKIVSNKGIESREYKAGFVARVASSLIKNLRCSPLDYLRGTGLAFALTDTFSFPRSLQKY